MKANKRKKIALYRRRFEAYNKWFREQVAQALIEADNPNTVMVPDAEVKKHFSVKRAEVLRRIELKSAKDSK